MQSLNPKQQLKFAKDLFPKFFLNTEAKDKISKIKIIEQEIVVDDLIYKTCTKTVSSFVRKSL